MLLPIMACLFVNILGKPLRHNQHKSHRSIRIPINVTDSHGSKRGYDVDCTETRCNWGHEHPCGGQLHHQDALLSVTNSQDAHSSSNMIDHCCERGSFRYTECVNGHEFPAVLQQQAPSHTHIMKTHLSETIFPTGTYHSSHVLVPNSLVHGIYDETATDNHNFHRVNDNAALHGNTNIHSSANFHRFSNHFGHKGYHSCTGMYSNLPCYHSTGQYDKASFGHGYATPPLHAYGHQANHGGPFDSVAYPEHVSGSPVHTISPKNGTNDYAGVAATLTNVPASLSAVSDLDAASQSWPIETHGNVLDGQASPPQEDVVDSLKNVNLEVSPAIATHMLNLANNLPKLAQSNQESPQETTNDKHPLLHTNMGVTDADVISADKQLSLPAAAVTAGPAPLSGHKSVTLPSNATITDTEVPSINVGSIAASPVELDKVSNLPEHLSTESPATLATSHGDTAHQVTTSTPNLVAGIEHKGVNSLSSHNDNMGKKNVNLDCGQSRITIEKATIIQEGINPQNVNAVLQKFCDLPSQTSLHKAVAFHKNTAVYVPPRPSMVSKPILGEKNLENTVLDKKTDNYDLAHHSNTAITDSTELARPTIQEQDSADLLVSSANVVEPASEEQNAAIDYDQVHHIARTPSHHTTGVVQIHNDVEQIGNDELTNPVNAYKKGKGNEPRSRTTQKKRTYSHKHLQRIPAT